MELTKYWVVASILLATTSRSAIVIPNGPDDALAVRDLVNIVTSCYGGDIDGVGLAGNLPDNLIRTLAERSIPVALNDETLKAFYPGRWLAPRFQHELRVFIFGPSDGDHLAQIFIANINYARWWNNMASYFILDLSPGCELIGTLLYTSWKLNIINAKVVCLEPRGGETVIAGFNPFTSQSPVSSDGIRVIEVQNEHPFTVFYQSYRNDEAICAILDFDKTSDLGGYEFHVRGDRVDLHQLNKKLFPFSYNFFTTNDRIMVNILDVLHAKPKFLSPAIGNELYKGGMSFTPAGIAFEPSSHSITYPHALIGFVIVTQFRGNKSQLNKILTVVDEDSRYGIGVVYLITLIFLKFFVHQALVPALLNLVRITCDTGFENLPNTTAPRVFLTGLLFFVVTIQGIYQGNLASLLTTIIPLRNVNAINDLVDLGYEKIYGFESVETIIDHPYVRERFIPVSDIWECMGFVKNDSSAACITMTDGTIDLALMYKLHVGTKIIAPAYISFPTLLFWPLKDRVNEIISRMVESSVLEPWDVKCNPVKFTDYDIDEDVKANVDFKNIELSEVAFAFVILGIGLACAGVTFVVELVVHRYQSRVASVRVQILN